MFSDVGIIAQLGLLMTKPSFRFDFAYVLAIFVRYLVCRCSSNMFNISFLYIITVI